jgi:predicted type IV restriction endonuclease
MPAYLELHDVSRISAEAIHSWTGSHWVLVTFREGRDEMHAHVALTLFMADADLADRYAAAINSVEMEKV